MPRTLIHALAAFGAVLIAAGAQAQTQAPTAFESLSAEIRAAQLDGPTPGESRTVYIWRPSNASPGPLPVLYMTDGVDGLYIALAGLHAAIMDGRVPPLLIIATEAHRARRLVEYVPTRRQMSAFDDHFDWFVNTVIPWSERVALASTERSQRAVGGYSNGADFALAAAERRPDLFGAVLAHSPVNSEDFRVDDRAAGIRWVLTAGRLESSEAEIVGLIDDVAAEIRERPAAVRRCSGYWDHEGAVWVDLSPGSVAWLFGFPDSDAVQTPREREACRNLSPN